MDMDEVTKELEAIEEKYSPKPNNKCPDINEYLHKNLEVFSKELDCLGLPMIDTEKPVENILEQTVKAGRDLVQITRSVATVIQEKKFDKVAHAATSKELYAQINDYKKSLEKLHQNCLTLKNSKQALIGELEGSKQRESSLKKELDNIKRAWIARDKHLEKVKALGRKEVQNLYKEFLKKDADSDLLTKLQEREAVYKSTICTLEENNQRLIHEILTLKEELILNNAKK